MILLNYLYKTQQILKLNIDNFISTLVLRLKLRLNCIDYGKGIKAMKSCPDIVVSKFAKKVIFKDNIIFNNYGDMSWFLKCKIMVREGAYLYIGRNVGMNGVLLYSSKSIIIHDNVKIGGATRIFDTDFHSLNYRDRRNNQDDLRKMKSAPIVIEEDAFIGAGCFIEKGVRIGARSIIAAGSVVIKSVPADEVWGGNPARFIRHI